ncbi:MAG: glycosyltransferase family 39 protein [Chloroflexi bacterium]|nr:glycosyltransferase family 39 protein [Chloroflexota bacterium]
MTQPSLSRQERFTIALLILIAFLARLALLQVDRVVWGDEPFYLWLGRNWITGQGYSFTGHPDVHHTPGYPFLTGIIYPLTHNMELSSDLCYLVFGSLLPLPIYLITRRIYGPPATFAGLLAALYPALTGAILRWGTLTEAPYYTLVYSGLYACLVALEDERRWAYALAGALFGAAYLVRPEAIGYIVVLFLFLSAMKLFSRRLFHRPVLAGLVLFAASAALFVLPYAAYTAYHTGHWMITEKAGVTFETGIGLAYGNTAAFDKSTWRLDSTGKEVYFFSPESYLVEVGGATITRTAFVKLILRNSWAFIELLFTWRLFPYFFLIPVGLALFQKPWDRLYLQRQLFMVASIAPVLGFVLFFVQERYIAAVLPGLLVWLGAGLWELGRWLSDTATQLRLPGAMPKVIRSFLNLIPLLFVLVYCLAMQPNMLNKTSTGSWRPAHKEIGLWLRDKVTPDTVIMSRYPAIAFHADTKWAATPNAEVGEITDYLQAKNVRYWVLDEREVRLRPQFEGLISGEAVPAWLRLIYSETLQGERMVVYEVML